MFESSEQIKSPDYFRLIPFFIFEFSIFTFESSLLIRKVSK